MKNTKKMMSLIGSVAMVCSANSFAKEKRIVFCPFIAFSVLAVKGSDVQY